MSVSCMSQKPVAALAALLLGGVSCLVISGTLHAADLGGSCCADLEERIAELEATTARKGNRKVSLTVSGQVNHAILAWDDGGETNTFVVSNSNSSDRVRFDGSARISKDLVAGYYLELGFTVASTAGVTQFEDNGANGLRTRQALWYVQSKSLGAISVGHGSPATDDIISNNLGGTSVAASANISLIGGGLFLRDSAQGGLNSLGSGNTISMRWRRFADTIDTSSANMVRYDSPVLMGFTVSASWGEDDIWDVALRYARSTKDFKIAFGVGYYENLDEEADTFGWPRGGDTEPNARRTEIRELKGSASILHEPTGLFASGAYVHREFAGTDLGVLTFACFPSADAQDLVVNTGLSCSNRPDYDYYWISGGIRRKWLPLGYTSLYGEFARSESALEGLNVSVRSAAGGDIDYVTSSTMNMWGVGLVQQISPAAMDVYFSYRHLEAEVEGFESTGSRLTAPLEDADLFMAGSRIRF